MQAFCLLTSMFENQMALVEVNPTAPVRSQRCPGVGRDLSVPPRYSLSGRMCTCGFITRENLDSFLS